MQPRQPTRNFDRDLASTTDVLDPEGWDGPFGPVRYGDVEIMYVHRALGFGLLLIPNAPLA